MARAQHSTKPLERVATEVERVVADLIDEAAAPGSVA
jgi:hypothetical protein